MLCYYLPHRCAKPMPSLMGLLQLRYEHDSSTIRALFGYNTLQHATTRYEVFRALAYEIDSSTPRESVVGVCKDVTTPIHILALFM